MAEIGVVASVIQIADTGLRLSIKLCTFGEIVASADKSVASISKDVSLTSLVLKELGEMLSRDHATQKLTPNAVRTADSVVKECLNVFQEMETMIVKKLPSLRVPDAEKSSKATILLERLKWPYLQPKLKLLQSHLEKLKSTILLMLNVIMYAGQLQSASLGDTTDPNIDDQVSLIEGLAESNRTIVRNFEGLKLGSKPYITLPAFESVSKDCFGTFKSTGQTNVLEDCKTEEEFRSLQNRHYMEMLTALLGEADKEKYYVAAASRSRVRDGLHNMFDIEIDFLAQVFENPQNVLAKDYFRSLVVASKNKWALREMSLRLASPRDDFRLSVAKPLQNSQLTSTGGGYFPPVTENQRPMYQQQQSQSQQSQSQQRQMPSMQMPSMQMPQMQQQYQSSGQDQALEGKDGEVQERRAHELTPLLAPTYMSASSASSRPPSAPTYASGPASSRYAAIGLVRLSVDNAMDSQSSQGHRSIPSEQASPSRSAPVYGPGVRETFTEPQCWDHGCNGGPCVKTRPQLRLSRGKSGSSPKYACHRCGAEFTRESARDGHVAHGKCTERSSGVENYGAENYRVEYEQTESKAFEAPSKYQFRAENDNGEAIVIGTPSKPVCWEHGCNGREFTTFSNLLRHQRQKTLPFGGRIVCHRCGAEFTRKTARDGHLAHDKCNREENEKRKNEEPDSGNRPARRIKASLPSPGLPPPWFAEEPRNYASESTQQTLDSSTEHGSPREEHLTAPVGKNQSQNQSQSKIVNELMALWIVVQYE